MSHTNIALDPNELLSQLETMAQTFGFQQLGISDIDLSEADKHLQHWLAQGFHGEMSFMEKHGSVRTHPDQLVPNTIRVITLRMDYWPHSAVDAWQVIENDQKAYLSRYALGRDYHKLIRKRLANFAEQMQQLVGEMGYRVFTDSAPVMEKALAEKAGLGWIGKHTNLLNRSHGSYFFLGEIFTDLPLPLTQAETAHCGTCTACIDVCPTAAIVAPYQLDARKCISYLTIELRDSIPEALRPMMGNRIYGCDDCQLVCPWNKYAQATQEMDFEPRHSLDDIGLVEIFAWTEAEFLQRFEGSPIRRIGYECWLRNIAVALGNATSSAEVIAALRAREHHPSELVREHVVWALQQHLSS
jgi:epoxyqueuosine reductase